MKRHIIIFLFLSTMAMSPSAISQETAQIRIDSLSQKLLIIKEDSSKVNIINKLAWEYLIANQPTLAAPYITKALSLSKKVNYLKGEAVATNYMGIFHQTNSNYAEAFSYYLQSLELNERAGYLKGIAFSNQSIGVVYLYQGNYAEAINYCKKALKIYEAIGDKVGIAQIHSNLAESYSKLGKHEDALFNNIEALKIFTEINNIGSISIANQHIGKTYALLHDYPKALEYQNKALVFAEKEGRVNLIVASLIGLAQCKTSLLKYEEARIDIKKALSLSRDIENGSTYRDAYAILSTLDSISGNWKEAYYNHLKYIASRDKVKNKEVAIEVVKSQARYEYEKQKAIDDLENEKRLAVETQKKEYQQMLSAAIGGVLLLALLLALGLWHRNRYIKKTNSVLALAKQQAERSEQYKQRFLANMSHEIRTPMHAISGMVKILERNKHLPSQDAFLKAMHTSSDNLVVILNDILDLSKIEAGKLDIENIPMRPVAVIENIIQILKYKAEEKGLAMGYKVDNDIPQLIMGAPTRLNQILVNLVGNAIKFTEKGSIDVLLSKVEDRLQYRIKDTGIGIPKDKLESIFGAFEQAKDSTNRNYGGTGLGLSISQQLTHLQNGKIWVESEEGKGSTFYVELPIVAAADDIIGQDLITEEKLKTMAASLKGIHILLAEDNEFNQMIAQDDLSYYIEDVKIDVVENGAFAVKKFQTGNYDLILMDVQMPEMNGFEATRKIRALEKAGGKEKTIPIIAMTASLLKSEIDNCYDVGMDNYIPKPYKPEELIAPIYSEMN